MPGCEVTARDTVDTDGCLYKNSLKTLGSLMYVSLRLILVYGAQTKLSTMQMTHSLS